MTSKSEVGIHSSCGTQMLEVGLHFPVSVVGQIRSVQELTPVSVLGSYCKRYARPQTRLLTPWWPHSFSPGTSLHISTYNHEHRAGRWLGLVFVGCVVPPVPSPGGVLNSICCNSSPWACTYPCLTPNQLFFCSFKEDMLLLEHCSSEQIGKRSQGYWMLLKCLQDQRGHGMFSDS